MRPTYESQESLKAEKLVADAIIQRWPVFKVHKTPKFYSCDYVILRKGIIEYLAEIKVRTNAHDAYPTYMVGLHKMMSYTQLAKFVDKPIVLFVGFTDGIWYLGNFDERTFGIGGRTDRNDEADVEPVVHFPMKNFKKL